MSARTLGGSASPTAGGSRPPEIFLRIKELTADNMRAGAHGIFHNRDHGMAAVGGIEGLPYYKWIRNNSC
jgi:hypothetical protein